MAHEKVFVKTTNDPNNCTRGAPVTGTECPGDKLAMDTYDDKVNTTLSSTGVTLNGYKTLISITELTIASASWTALPATASRRTIGIQNPNNIEIKINNATPAGYVGWEVAKQGELFLDIESNLVLNVKAKSGTPTIVVMELG